LKKEAAMLKSMTGFGAAEIAVPGFGTINVELRSTNHKFFEMVFHSPDGFICFEDKIKKEIETRIKRGRVICVLSVFGKASPRVSMNKELLRRYVAAIKDISKLYRISDGMNINTLVGLPGVLSLTEEKIPVARFWPHLGKAVAMALSELSATRSKEGRALFGHLDANSKGLSANLKFIRSRFAKIILEKSRKIKIDAERAAFLKDADIAEEIDRLDFHIKSFKGKLNLSCAIGKELDFICQEMQREANTMGAKACDMQISGRVVQMKSQIEKLREQAQNIE
jgi:uncharacterized protein (TIGR00255 family)